MMKKVFFSRVSFKKSIKRNKYNENFRNDKKC